MLAVCLAAAATRGQTLPSTTKEVEPNNAIIEAQKVPADTDVSATASVGDSDFFRIQVEKPTYLRLAVTPIPGADLVLVLYDEDERDLCRRDGQGVGKPEELVRRVRRGTYFAGVFPKGDGKADKAPYTLTVRQVTLMDYEPSIEQIKAAIKKGLKYMASQQKPDGRWEPRMGHYGVTGLAMMGFVAERLPEFRPNVQKAVALFTKSYVKPGTFPDQPDVEAKLAGSLIGSDYNGEFMYEHAIATLAMAEYVHQDKDPKARAMLTEAVKLLLRSQGTAAKPKVLGGPVAAQREHFGAWRYQPDADTGDLSASGWCLIALAAAEKAGVPVPANVRKDYMIYCRKCFNEAESAYAYDTNRADVTYTTNSIGVLTTLMCVGGKCPVVRKGLRTIRENMPGWEEEGGRGKYPFYYWYYASRAMYVAGGEYWKQWQAVICPMLLDHQNADGSWDASQDEEEKVGKLYTTTLAILILQLCSGNPPAYLEGLKLETAPYPCPTLVDDIEAQLKAAAKDDRSKEQLIKQLREMIDRFRGE